MEGFISAPARTRVCRGLSSSCRPSLHCTSRKGDERRSDRSLSLASSTEACRAHDMTLSAALSRSSSFSRSSAIRTSLPLAPSRARHAYRPPRSPPTIGARVTRRFASTQSMEPSADEERETKRAVLERVMSAHHPGADVRLRCACSRTFLYVPSRLTLVCGCRYDH
jgi:hypothetical protein